MDSEIATAAQTALPELKAFLLRGFDGALWHLEGGHRE
jgi:hypothetical protein